MQMLIVLRLSHLQVTRNFNNVTILFDLFAPYLNLNYHKLI